MAPSWEEDNEDYSDDCVFLWSGSWLWIRSVYGLVVEKEELVIYLAILFIAWAFFAAGWYVGKTRG